MMRIEIWRDRMIRGVLEEKRVIGRVLNEKCNWQGRAGYGGIVVLWYNIKFFVLFWLSDIDIKIF